MQPRAAIRRVLLAIAMLAFLAGAFLAGSAATSSDARAEWWGYCGAGGATGFNCTSVEQACSTTAAAYGETYYYNVLHTASYATCHTTPRLGGYTTFNTALSCPGGKTVDLGYAWGCSLPDPEPCDCEDGEGGGGTPTPTGGGSGGGPVSGTGTASGGNPISVDNGNKLQSVTDYRSSGADVLEFKRYYNGRSNVMFNMGLRWRHNYSANLAFPSSTKTEVHRPSGRILEFTSATGADPWTPTLGGIVGRLSKTGGGWTYTRGDDTVETYNSSGSLLSIEKKNGYTQTIDKAVGGVAGLWEIADSHGRTLTLDHTYMGSSAGWRVKRLVDPDGRVYTYNYSGVSSTNYQPWLLDEVVYPDDTPDPAATDGVTLLSHFDGPNNGKQATDESLNGHHLNFVYPAYVATDQSKFGGASVRFKQPLFNKAYISIPDGDDWHFGAGEFTAEGWVRVANNSGYRTLFRQWGDNTQKGWALDWGASGGQIRFLYSTNGTGSAAVAGTWRPARNVWYHIAVDRDAGNNLRVYVNGVVKASAVVTAALHDSTAGLEIGRFLNGWIDEPRIDKGRARYAGAFTPPTAAYPGLRQDNPRTTYQFEDTGFRAGLTGITDETGQRTNSWAYDSDGRGTLSQHGGGADQVTMSYGTGTTTVTNPLGKDFEYSYSPLLGRDRITRIDRLASAATPAGAMSFAYDANAWVNQVTDWNGNITKYVHNSRGLQTSRTEGFGTPEARTTTTAWDPAFRVPTRIAAPERTTDMTYDADGLMLTRMVTDTTSHVVPYSTNGQTRTTTYTYNAQGLVATADGPLPGTVDTTTYAYDPVTGDLTGVTNPLGHVTQITSYDASGRPLTMKNANGVETTLAYHARGWLETRTVDSGVGGTPAVTTFAYDAAGQMASTTLPDDSVMTYEYDAADRLAAIENGVGERIEYTYDLMGNRTGQTVKDASLAIVRQASSTFDDLGRLLKSLGAYVGEETDFAYDANGNTVSVTDPLSNVTGSAFDALDRLATVTDALTNTATYAYDLAGNRETATDQRGLVTSYVHNGFGEVIQQSSPDSGVTIYEYDTAGRRSRRTDARGVVTDWTYDDLGRTLTMTFPASPAENVAYTYDDPTAGYYGIGGVASVTDDSGSTSYRYDAQGNTVRVDTVVATIAYVTEYSYDLADRVTQIIYPSGRIVDYARDTIGRVTDVSTRANALATPVALGSGGTYEAFGGIDGMTFGNGVTLVRGFDLDGRMATMDAFNGGTPVLDLDYTFDLAGNITDIDDIGLGNRGRDYAYDPLHRLTQGKELAPGGAPVTLQTDYTWDAVGNRLTRNAGGSLETLAYDAFSNQLDTVTAGAVVRTLGYSASGNTATDDDGAGTVLTHNYDSTDRLAEIKQGAATVAAYLHNAQGQRVAKTVGAATVHYVYDLGGNMISEHDGGTGAATAEYVWLGGMPLAYIQGGAVYYVHADHLNAPQRITDGSAAVVWDASYRPFGDATVTGALTFNLRFPGQYLDAETGLHYNGFRDYDPGTGRYIQSDPIGLGGGWNSYGYVGGNPVRFIDPMGLAPTCEIKRYYDKQKWSESGTRYGAWEFSDDSGFRGKTADGVWLILSCIWKRTITDYRKDFERLVWITAQVCTDECGDVSVTPIGDPQPVGLWRLVFEGEWARTQEFEDIVESGRRRGPKGGVGGGAQAKSACGVLSKWPPEVY